MSTSADGDGRPDNERSDDLPELPADWGPIVIPDDASELAAEAAQVRRELRALRRRERWRRRLGLPVDGTRRAPLRLPLLIMSVALLAALVSLLAITWPNQPAPPPVVRTSSPGGTPTRTLPALDLIGEDGQLVPLRGLLPAVIILTDACACPEVVDSALRAAPPGVTVVTVSRRRPSAAPSSSATGPVARALTDPTGELRQSLRLAPHSQTATALLVARSGQVVRVVPAVTSLAGQQADLARLATD